MSSTNNIAQPEPVTQELLANISFPIEIAQGLLDGAPPNKNREMMTLFRDVLAGHPLGGTGAQQSPEEALSALRMVAAMNELTFLEDELAQDNIDAARRRRLKRERALFLLSCPMAQDGWGFGTWGEGEGDPIHETWRKPFVAQLADLRYIGRTAVGHNSTPMASEGTTQAKQESAEVNSITVDELLRRLPVLKRCTQSWLLNNTSVYTTPGVQRLLEAVVWRTDHRIPTDHVRTALRHLLINMGTMAIVRHLFNGIDDIPDLGDLERHVATSYGADLTPLDTSVDKLGHAPPFQDMAAGMAPGLSMDDGEVDEIMVSWLNEHEVRLDDQLVEYGWDKDQLEAEAAADDDSVVDEHLAETTSTLQLGEPTEPDNVAWLTW